MKCNFPRNIIPSNAASSSFNNIDMYMEITN